jgi:hypothetical protein
MTYKAYFRDQAGSDSLFVTHGQDVNALLQHVINQTSRGCHSAFHQPGSDAAAYLLRQARHWLHHRTYLSLDPEEMMALLIRVLFKLQKFLGLRTPLHDLVDQMAAEAPSRRMQARSQEFPASRKRPGTYHACMWLTYACRAAPGRERAYSIRPRCQLECPLTARLVGPLVLHYNHGGPWPRTHRASDGE